MSDDDKDRRAHMVVALYNIGEKLAEAERKLADLREFVDQPKLLYSQPAAPPVGADGKYCQCAQCLADERRASGILEVCE